MSPTNHSTMYRNYDSINVFNSSNGIAIINKQDKKLNQQYESNSHYYNKIIQKK